MGWPIHSCCLFITYCKSFGPFWIRAGLQPGIESRQTCYADLCAVSCMEAARKLQECACYVHAPTPMLCACPHLQPILPGVKRSHSALLHPTTNASRSLALIAQHLQDPCPGSTGSLGVSEPNPGALFIGEERRNAAWHLACMSLQHAHPAMRPHTVALQPRPESTAT